MGHLVVNFSGMFGSAMNCPDQRVPSFTHIPNCLGLLEAQESPQPQAVPPNLPLLTRIAMAVCSNVIGGGTGKSQHAAWVSLNLRDSETPEPPACATPCALLFFFFFFFFFSNGSGCVFNLVF
jgi:hypothetical protein